MATQSELSQPNRHDRIFKEFFYRFLPQFLRLFYPEEASRLNLDSIKFLDKELMINLPEQRLRIADVVAAVDTLEGQTETILVHIELEANHPHSFPRRMFEYYALLRILRQQPVLPIALVLRRGVGGLQWRAYTETLFGRELLTFHYGQVGIRDLLGEGYMAYKDPVAGALAVLMDVNEEQRPILKLSALQGVLASDLTEGDKLFLMKLINTYLPTAELMAIGGEVMEKLEDIELTYYERMELEFTKKGLEEGREEGREEGQLLGKRNLLQKLLAHRFGELPGDILSRIDAIQDHNLFDPLVEQALTAQSITDLTFPTPVAIGN